MTLENVLELMWREIAKNVWKKFQKGQNRHFLGGVFCNSSIEQAFQKAQKERLEAERKEAKRQRALARINKL